MNQLRSEQQVFEARDKLLLDCLLRAHDYVDSASEYYDGLSDDVFYGYVLMIHKDQLAMEVARQRVFMRGVIGYGLKVAAILDGEDVNVDTGVLESANLKLESEPTSPEIARAFYSACGIFAAAELYLASKYRERSIPPSSYFVDAAGIMADEDFPSNKVIAWCLDVRYSIFDDIECSYESDLYKTLMSASSIALDEKTFETLTNKGIWPATPWASYALDSERYVDAVERLGFVEPTCCTPPARPDAPPVDITTLLHVREDPSLEGGSLLMKVPREAADWLGEAPYAVVPKDGCGQVHLVPRWRYLSALRNLAGTRQYINTNGSDNVYNNWKTLVQAEKTSLTDVYLLVSLGTFAKAGMRNLIRVRIQNKGQCLVVSECDG